MELVIISDTHGHHESLGTLRGDVLIHCGDGVGGFGRDPRELDALDDWFGRQEFEQILFVAGNHDRAVERRVARGEPPLRNARYLQDASFTWRGVTFYGAPWIPELLGWPFYQSSAQLRERWAAIPRDLDVLITHTPPAGILDRSSLGRGCGCPLLARAIERRPPALHCFGHIHHSAGTLRRGGTTFVNASSFQRGARGRLREPVEVRFAPVR